MIKQRFAVYPGTFDPITFGHLDIIKRASRLFDDVVVAIAQDVVKRPLFSLDERFDMVHHEIIQHKITNVSVRTFEGLLANFMNSEGIAIIIRGIRAVSDFEYEFKMSYMNCELNPEIETVFLPASHAGHFISSSFVKEVSALGGCVSKFVPPYVEKKLHERKKKIA